MEPVWIRVLLTILLKPALDDAIGVMALKEDGPRSLLEIGQQ